MHAAAPYIFQCSAIVCPFISSLMLLHTEMKQQIIKGVSHCFLPECNKVACPFMNYCSKEHEELGKKRKLLRKFHTIAKCIISVVVNYAAPQLPEYQKIERSANNPSKTGIVPILKKNNATIIMRKMMYSFSHQFG